jgi:hypothetical protein
VDKNKIKFDGPGRPPKSEHLKLKQIDIRLPINNIEKIKKHPNYSKKLRLLIIKYWDIEYGNKND